MTREFMTIHGAPRYTELVAAADEQDFIRAGLTGRGPSGMMLRVEWRGADGTRWELTAGDGWYPVSALVL